MLPNLKPASLAHIPLFSNLLPEQLAQVSSLLKSKVFPAETNVFTAGFASDVVYIIQCGTIKMYMEQIDGSAVILDVLGPGEVVGDIGLIDDSCDAVSIVTMETTCLLWMPRSVFQECLRTIPQLSNNLLRVLSRRLRRAEEHIQSLAKLDVYGRLAQRILAFAEEYGEMTHSGAILIPLRLTQSDLADLVGASRVRVNQVLVVYKRHNYISVDQTHCITVHNADALAKYCHQRLAS